MKRAIVHVWDGKLVSDNANYQGFVYDIAAKVCIPTNERTKAKWESVAHVFPSIVRGKSFMDVGASTGFFCFKALECGATKAIAVEYKAKRSVPMQAVLKKCPVSGLVWIHEMWPKVKYKADVTMFLSVLHHWCAQHRKAFEVVLRDISKCTKHTAIVEWVERNDVGAASYKIPKWYRRAQFEEIAKTWFTFEIVGEGHRSTRIIYLLRRK